MSEFGAEGSALAIQRASTRALLAGDVRRLSTRAVEAWSATRRMRVSPLFTN